MATSLYPGTAIHALRKQAGLSQVELAKRMGTDQAAISNWETGAITPSVSALTRLAEVFTVSVDALLGRDLPSHSEPSQHSSPA